MYELNGQQFRTKDALKKYIQHTIKTLNICSISSNHEYFNLFSELMQNHENRDEKVGCGIERFSIGVNPQNYAERSLFLHRIDGSEDVWSYKACIGIKKNDLNEAMRAAVKEQMLEYKKTQEMKCCYCGITNSTKQIEFHVDHKTVPFCNIRNDFLKLNSETPTKFAKNKTYFNMIFRDEDQNFEQKWSEFHRKHADYQILCKECNLKKSNN